MQVDYWRQAGFFNNINFKYEIHVVGAGATGSHVVDSLVNAGITSVKVYDFDKVELHNIPNQVYFLKDVGKFKVDALAEYVKAKTGIEIEAINEKVECIKMRKPGMLILCTDKMQTQKDLVLNSGKQLNCIKVIETRMGLEHGRVYAFDPNSKIELRRWLSMWYPDEAAEESPCNMRSINTTAKTLAAYAAHQVLSFSNDKSHYKDGYNEIIVQMSGENHCIKFTGE